jgi:hypothetical protein
LRHGGAGDGGGAADPGRDGAITGAAIDGVGPAAGGDRFAGAQQRGEVEAVEFDLAGTVRRKILACLHAVASGFGSSDGKQHPQPRG